MPTILVTGASRGLGLEFARQYAAEGWRVIATCRKPDNASNLQNVEGDCVVHKLDVIDAKSIDKLATDLAGIVIDLLLLNAGVNLQRNYTLTELDEGLWLEELKVNAIAPLMVARRFIDHVAQSEQKRIVAISSNSGSIALIRKGGSYAYRSSKAALNAIIKILSADVMTKGITAVAVAPGHSRTDMTRMDALYSAAESAASVRATISRLKFEDSGGFFSREGRILPW